MNIRKLSKINDAISKVKDSKGDIYSALYNYAEDELAGIIAENAGLLASACQVEDTPEMDGLFRDSWQTVCNRSANYDNQDGHGEMDPGEFDRQIEEWIENPDLFLQDLAYDFAYELQYMLAYEIDPPIEIDDDTIPSLVRVTVQKLKTAKPSVDEVFATYDALSKAQDEPQDDEGTINSLYSQIEDLMRQSGLSTSGMQKVIAMLGNHVDEWGQ